MSLENNIAKLTLSIDALVAVMQTMSAGANVAVEAITELKEVAETVVEEVTEAEKLETTDKQTAAKINAEAKKKALAETKARKEKEAEEKAALEDAVKDDEEVKVPTVEDLKAACLVAARSAADAKVKVKKVLKEFDANVAKDVAPADRVTIIARLESEF